MTHLPLTLPDRLSSSPTPTGWRMSTRASLALVILGTVGTSWLFGHFVLSREMFAQVFGQSTDPAAIESRWALTKRYAAWGYVLQAPGLALKITLTALTIQLIALVSGEDSPYRVAFRAAVAGAGVMLAGTAIKIAWLLGAVGVERINSDWLNVSPLSLAAILFDPPSTPSIAYTALSAVSMPELAWIAVVAWVLTSNGMKRAAAYASAAGTWAIVVTLQCTMALLISGMGS
jgi:hypothetical protein